jgi:hypothetical protein
MRRILYPTLTSLVLLSVGSATAADLFNNMNKSTVARCAPPFVGCQPQFRLPRPGMPTTVTSFQIDEITTYHVQGAAAAGKTISLKSSSGAVIGTFPVRVTPATPGFENWTATVSTQVVADTYTVSDSQADTWAQNSASGDDTATGGKGFTSVTGSIASSAGAPDDASDTDCEASCALPNSEAAKSFPPPIFECSAHGPHAQCRSAPPTSDNPGINLMCTDGRHTTTCNCRTGCTTH